MKPTQNLFLPVLLTSGLLTLLMQGADLYWDGDSSTPNGASDNTSTADTDWLSGGNWDDGTTSAAKASWTDWDTATFGGSFAGTQKVTLGSGVNLGSLIIGGATSQYNISVTGTGFNQLGNPSGPITVNAGSTLSADAASNNAHNIGAVTLNGGTLTSINGPAGPANDGGFGNWLFRGDVTVAGSSASAISATQVTIGTGGGVFSVADATSSTDTDLLVSSKIISGSITKTGAGTMALTGTNTYTGGTTINEGTIVLTEASGAGDATGAIRGDVTINTGGTLTVTTSNALGYGGGAKVNTMNINGGTYRTEIDADNGWGVTWNLTGGSITAASNGRISFGGGSVINTLASDTSSIIGANIVIREGNVGDVGTFNVEDGTADVDLAVGGVISGSRGLSKTGAGTMLLTGANTYSGGTTISEGTLSAGSGGTKTANRLGSGALSVAAGAVLTADKAVPYGLGGYSGTITNSGSMVLGQYASVNSALVLDGGTVEVYGSTYSGSYQGAQLYNGNISVQGDTQSVIKNNDGDGTNYAIHLLAGTKNGGNGVLFDVADGASAVDLLVSAALTNESGDAGGGSGALTKTGAGTLELSGNSTYTGATTVSAGTLLVNGSLGNTAVFIDAAATIGGTGSIGGTLDLAEGARVIYNSSDPLSVTGTLTFASFGFDDLLDIDPYTAALGEYLVIDGDNISFTNVENFGLANAFTRGDGNLVYFDEGSLKLVVAVPEVSVTLLAGIAMLAMLRRRRGS